MNKSLAEQATQLATDELALRYLEERLKSGAKYEEVFDDAMQGASVSAKEYAIQTKGVAGSTDVFVTKQKQAQESLKATTAASKGASIAMKALATVGNMFIGWAISEVLTLASKAISDYINRLEISKEKLAETEGELESVNAEFEETASKIKELESLGTPSLTDKEDLERLRAENKELAIRKKYLEDQKKLESEDVVQYAKEKMDYNYGRTTSRESIDAYKAYMDNPTLYTSETDTTTIKIAQYEHYQELRKQALENEDLETIEILDTKLKDIEESLLSDRTELQNFKDDLSLTGEASPELDNVINKLEFIDNLLLAPSENLKNFLNSDEIVKDTAKLTELAYSGELTESQFKESFSKINTYLEENGLTFQDLISVLGIYRDELEGLPEGNETADLWNFSETIENLDDAKERLETLDEAYAKLFDGDKNTNIGFEDFKEINDAFADVSGIDNYIKRLQEAGNNTEQVTAVMEDLIDAYLDHSKVLDNVTMDNKELIITMLEEMGIANAEQIVIAQLTNEKAILDQVTQVLTNNTEDEIEAFFKEIDASEETKVAMSQLALEKLNVNNTTIDTSADIANIIALAETAGASTVALGKLAEAKRILGAVEKHGALNVARYKEGITTAQYNEAKAIMESIENGTFDYGYSKVDVSKIYDKVSNTKPTWSPQNSIGTKTAESMEKAADAMNKASEAMKDTVEVVDFFEERAKKLNNALELLKTNAENVQGSFAKNKLIDAQIGLSSEKINNYTDAMAMYTQKANEALSKLPSDIASKIKNGAVSITDFTNSEEITKAISEYQKWSDSIASCKLELAKLREELERLELAKFENIVKDFEDMSKIYESGKDIIDAYIKYYTESGDLIGQAFYEASKVQSEKQLELLNQQKEKLVAQLNSALNSGRVDLCPAV